MRERLFSQGHDLVEEPALWTRNASPAASRRPPVRSRRLSARRPATAISKPTAAPTKRKGGCARPSARQRTPCASSPAGVDRAAPSTHKKQGGRPCVFCF